MVPSNGILTLFLVLSDWTEQAQGFLVHRVDYNADGLTWSRKPQRRTPMANGPSLRRQNPQRSGFVRNAKDDPSTDNNAKNEFWSERWKMSDKVEIRLDATIVSCHTLARFFVYDINLPIKKVPGMEITDVVAILDTFTSAVVLSILWIVAGLVTRLFEAPQDYGRLLSTNLLAAPIWLGVELLLGWPAMESPSYLEGIVLGTLGLFATMSLSRLIPPSLR